MNAQQALRLIKYYFVCMKISRPVEAGCLGSQRILTYFHSYRRARERISWHNVCPPKARSAAFTLVTNLSWPLPNDFVLVKRLWISWFPQLRFCGRSRNLEFTSTITNLSEQDVWAPGRLGAGVWYSVKTMALVNKLVRWAWFSSGALEVWRFRLRYDYDWK